jgi:adhesin transport system membrane fusion protein
MESKPSETGAEPATHLTRALAWLQKITLTGPQFASSDAPLGSRRIIRIVGAAFGVFALWAALFTLDIASHSAGEVVTSSQTQVVQHLEGGIVRTILVREGQSVRAGDALVELERTASDAELNELEAHIGGLQIRILRLHAQQEGRLSFDVPAELVARFPAQVQTARELFESQRMRLAGSLEVQGTKITQREAESQELLARREQLRSKLGLQREQIAISERLLKDGLTNQYEHLNLLKEEQVTLGVLNETEAGISRVSAGRRQETASLKTLAVGDREELQKDLEDARKQLSEFQERLLKYTDSQRRTVVRAPIDGTVMTMNVATEGGVIAPGGTLLTLVPAGTALLIEAKLPIGDVGLIRPGQSARVQLVSSSARGYKPMDATVIDISPDSVTERDQNEERYYRVRLQPAAPAFDGHARHYSLAPGVNVSVAILTGERSVLGYIFDPLVSGMSSALTEP